MYIEPNGQVKLLHSGLPSDYTDTIWFNNITDQYNYFNGLTGTWLNAQSYTRVNRGVFRCSLPMSQAYNFDYMMFRNVSFENKWFFAFVTKIDYINNGLCEVHFMIDVIQTWFAGNKATLGESFVSRETVADDTIGSNLEAETLPSGEYVCDKGSVKNMTIGVANPAIIVAIVDTDGDPSGKRYDRTYGGATLYAYDYQDIAGVNALIKQYQDQGKPDAVQSIYMVPFQSLPNGIPDNHLLSDSSSAKWYTFDEPAISAGTSLGGYVPKNNKCYTYPFTFCRVTTGQGNKADYRYEFFDGLQPSFWEVSNLTPPINALCYPRRYKGFAFSNTDGTPYACEGLSISGYPMCSWNYDTYAAWVAQNSVPMANVRNAWKEKATYELASGAIKAANAGMSGALSGAGPAGINIPGAIAGGLIGALSSAGQTLASIGESKVDLVLSQTNADYSASIEADTMGGTIANGSIAFSAGQMKFIFSRWHCALPRLQAIDEFFSMFGYAVNRVKTPDILSRPHWNYIKTIDADIRGDMPSDDRNAIKSIFDNGIRFWKNGSEIGNYSLDNRP